MEKQNNEKDCTNQNSSRDLGHHQFEYIDSNFEYYQLFHQLMAESLKVKSQLIHVNKRQEELTKRIQYLSGKADNFKDYVCPEETPKKKFERRGSDEITKPYICPIGKCNHSYGSETAYRKHLKLKHPEEYCPKKRGRSQNRTEVQMILQL